MRKIITKIKSSKSLRDIITLSGAQLALRPLQIAKSFVVAKYLGPEMFGILKSVELIGMLNKFGSLGFRPTVIRNASTAIAQGNYKEARIIKNNAYTGELILSLFLFFVGLASSFFFSEKIISVAIILGSIGLFTAKLLGIGQTELQLNKSFGSLGKIILYQGVISSVLVIATVPFFNIYSVLIVPSISSIVVSFWLFRITGKFFSFKINKSDFINILKVSIPLTFETLAYGLFRYTERIIIITYLGLTATGYFGFADTIANIFVSLMIGSIMKVRGIKIFEELAKKNFIATHKMIVKETSILFLISLLIIVGIAFGMKIFIPMILPKWEGAITTAILYSFVIPIQLSSTYVVFVIKSPTVNKLKFGPIMRVLATLIMVIGAFILNHYEVVHYLVEI